MDTFTIMAVSSTMQDKSNCYVKVVAENYYCDKFETIYPKIHLVFLSKQDYNKITEIDKMCEKYFDLERIEVDEEEKENILYRQLKKLIRYLNESEVMEVLGNHFEAFYLMFDGISCIIMKSRKMKQTRLIVYDEDEDEDEDEETLIESSYISEKYESERLKKTIMKVESLLLDKIRYQ